MGLTKLPLPQITNRQNSSVKFNFLYNFVGVLVTHSLLLLLLHYSWHGACSCILPNHKTLSRQWNHVHYLISWHEKFKQSLPRCRCRQEEKGERCLFSIFLLWLHCHHDHQHYCLLRPTHPMISKIRNSNIIHSCLSSLVAKCKPNHHLPRPVLGTVLRFSSWWNTDKSTKGDNNYIAGEEFNQRVKLVWNL